MYFWINFALFLPLLGSPSPKLWAKFVILLHLPVSFGVYLDQPKFRFHSLCQSTVIEEKPFVGVDSTPPHLPLVTEGFKSKRKKAEG